jgi:hypothetical protein
MNIKWFGRLGPLCILDVGDTANGKCLSVRGLFLPAMHSLSLLLFLKRYLHRLRQIHRSTILSHLQLFKRFSMHGVSVWCNRFGQYVMRLTVRWFLGQREPLWPLLLQYLFSLLHIAVKLYRHYYYYYYYYYLLLFTESGDVATAFPFVHATKQKTNTWECEWIAENFFWCSTYI